MARKDHAILQYRTKEYNLSFFVQALKTQKSFASKKSWHDLVFVMYNINSKRDIYKLKRATIMDPTCLDEAGSGVANNCKQNPVLPTEGNW